MPFPDQRTSPSSASLYWGVKSLSRTTLTCTKSYLPRTVSLLIGSEQPKTGNIRWYFIDKETEVTGGAVPVGYRLEDIEVMLLNDDGKEVEVNDPGEIAVKSRYLSPGYWRQPTLTAAKFTTDQCQGDDRVYLTGDLGRMSNDGCLYHLGRKDFQVKVRGYRVDPGEVETALLQHNQVREVAVVGRKNQLGDSQLVAYVVPAENIRLNISGLRKFFGYKLPDYMIPASFIPIDSLPLTPNGKINHRLLPVPDRSRPEVETPMVAPRSEVEKKVAQIWMEILALDEVGIGDNFLALGGDSLSASRVVSSVIRHFQVEIPLRALFQSPTIAEMAGVIVEHQRTQLGDVELEKILDNLESLSDEMAERLVSEDRSTDYKS